MDNDSAGPSCVTLCHMTLAGGVVDVF